ncbi:MAG: hypothetical protein GY895_01010 [Phycisphaera sp.]|nr:hypothetical protein [Phycisphaera sp.]
MTGPALLLAVVTSMSGIATPPTDSEVHSPAPPTPASPPAVTPHPIARSCDRLIAAEVIRVELPEGPRSLETLLEVSASRSGMRVDADWTALDAIGISPRDEVVSDGIETSLLVALESSLSRLGTTWEKPRIESSPGGLLVTTDSGSIRLSAPIAYPIGDLLRPNRLPTAVPRTEGDPPTDPAATESIDPRDRIADLVLDLCRRDEWEANGGSTSRLRMLDDMLVIDAPPSIQVVVARLLDQLRAARPGRLEIDLHVLRVNPAVVGRIQSEHGAGAANVAQRILESHRQGVLLTDAFEVPIGITAHGSIETDELTAEYRFTPSWDTERRIVVGRIEFEIAGTDAQGRRRADRCFDLRVPSGGAVVLLPTAVGQRPLAITIGCRSR